MRYPRLWEVVSATKLLIPLGDCSYRYVPQSFSSAFGEGVMLIIQSTVIGVLGGAALCFLQKLAQTRGNEVLEGMFLILSAYALFAVGELNHMSGIITCMFGGLVIQLLEPAGVAKIQIRKTQ